MHKSSILQNHQVHYRYYFFQYFSIYQYFPKFSIKNTANICRIQKEQLPLHPSNDTNIILILFGEMAEWSIAAVLKTVEGHTSGGSNPSLSATNIANQLFTDLTPGFTPKNVKSGVFILFKIGEVG